MKKFLLSTVLMAFAFAATAGDQTCSAAKTCSAEKQKSACCMKADQAKAGASCGKCPMSAKKAVKSPKAKSLA